MKKIFSLLTISALAFFVVLVVLPSCEGPQGDPGIAGVDGKDGTDGTDGVDANSFCVNCHTLDNKTTIKEQFAKSSHGMGNYVSYAGGRGACAKCHSYQGAMETMLTGKDTTAVATIGLPVAFQCDMCHVFHESLDEADFPDYALRDNDPVSLIATGHTTMIDLPGSANVCVECHQLRRGTSPQGGDSVNISNTHWGGHHGPQGAIMAGVGAFEPAGSMAYENSSHTTLIGCSDCHMVKNASRTEVGGHTWVMQADDGYQNMAACVDCHAGATSFDINGLQTKITGLLEELHGLLAEHGLYSEEGLHEGGHPVTGMRSAEEAGAVFNYILFEEGRSKGVHNPTYIEACLTNTIEMVESW